MTFYMPKTVKCSVHLRVINETRMIEIPGLCEQLNELQGAESSHILYSLMLIHQDIPRINLLSNLYNGICPRKQEIYC